MKRRELILAAAGLPFWARAQPRRTATVGVIVPGWANAWGEKVAALRRGLRERGYVEGQNLRLETRYAEGKLDRVAGFAAELGAIPVNVLVTAGSHVTRVTRKSTQDVPIVMAYAGDPVGGGLADSLPRPGGRITGLTSLTSQLAAKRLELLKEILPKHKHVGVLWNPEVPERDLQFKETQAAARKLGIKIHSFEIRAAEEVVGTLHAASSRRIDAMIVLQDALLQSHLKTIVDAAMRERLPNLHQEVEAVRLGGMLSYGASFSDLFYRAAGYVDKILKGAKPADLPIEQPTKFELVVNLKAAKAIGLEIPKSVLLRADEVIE